jgi:DNA-binding NtrC family response regulator
MLTADNTVQSAVQAMKLGAKDYLNKPFDVENLTSLIVDTLEELSAKAIAPQTPDSLSSAAASEIEGDFGPLVGKSAPMLELYDKISTVAERDTTILITGESGTGKELVARRIHDLSLRNEKPFVAINCAAIPETLIESELFGHEKGAFTSAIDKRVGYFELADGGTIFLDEIGELSLPVQVKMLRFLQEHELYRVGQSQPIHVDVRVIAATNKNLEELIREQKFRQDLYYRINVINMELPALRDRTDDVSVLTDHFVEKFAPQYGERQLSFNGRALSILKEYSWPGNVRELENVVESLMALAPQDRVRGRDLPAKLSRSIDSEGFDKAVFDGSLNFQEAERTFETEMIFKALKRTNNVQTKAAELLGISRRILKYKMDKLGITEKLEAEEAEKAAKKNSKDKDSEQS